MIEPWYVAAVVLTAYALHSSVLGGAAWLLERTGRIRSVHARERLWRLTLWVPMVTVGVHVAGWSVARPGLAPWSALPFAALATAPLLAFAERWARAMTPLWSLGAALAVVRLALAAVVARRELARRTEATAELLEQFEALRAERGVSRGRLSIAADLPGPVTLANDEIVLPPWVAERLGASHRRVLLAHELAHVVRNDARWSVFGLLVKSVFWFQPLHDLARRRLAHLAELQADAWAPRGPAEASALAECLVECAERVQLHRSARFGAAMASGGPLRERVDHLLTGSFALPSRIAGPVGVAGLATALAGIALLPVLTPDPLGAGIRTGSSRTLVERRSDGALHVQVKQRGYAAELVSTGAVSFRADSSDVQHLAAGSRFELRERLRGGARVYRVRADRGGELVREYGCEDRRAREATPDSAWRAAALRRALRAAARGARSLARPRSPV